MNLQEWATKRVEELTETGKFHLDNGWTLEFTIATLRKETTLGTKYWPIVVENLTNYSNSK